MSGSGRSGLLDPIVVLEVSSLMSLWPGAVLMWFAGWGIVDWLRVVDDESPIRSRG